jgi:hypothetical protein
LPSRSVPKANAAPLVHGDDDLQHPPDRNGVRLEVTGAASGLDERAFGARAAVRGPYADAPGV